MNILRIVRAGALAALWLATCAAHAIEAPKPQPAPAPTPASLKPPASQPAAAGLPADDGSSVPLALVLAAGAGLLTAWLTLMQLSRRGRAEGEPPLDT